MDRSVRIPVGRTFIDGELDVPAEAGGIVIFAHGSGSSRHSPRNRFVAGVLQAAGIGTLLLDLLTHEEEAEAAATRQLRFDIELLAERLLAATAWLEGQPGTGDLAIGYFGASTGAAAALIAAARRPEAIAAVVSRGGRPDLAGESLRRVKAATLLIVGAEDHPVIPLNRQGFSKLTEANARGLLLVPHATHLFSEPGTLETVARLAAYWFHRHLREVRPVESAEAPETYPAGV